MQPDESLIGRQLQQYRVTSVLGRGGMGVVYRAQDVRLGRDVAIKVLPPGELDDLTRHHRFLREAQAASVLSHPNVVTVYEIDSSEGMDFIVMELVEGRALSGCIPPTGLPLNLAIRYALQMLEGVAAAHRAGLVHRDLKPGNLMVRDDGVLKVLDFGLARRQVTDDGETATMLTETGQVMGTIAYMSPEQARGLSVGPPSDVFAMGVIAYEMVTGCRPFQGSGLSVLHALIEGKFDAVRKARPECPEALGGVIARALASEPALRYADADEMLEQFRKATLPTAEPTRTMAVPTAAGVPHNSRAWRRTALAAGGVAIAGTLSIAAWYGWQRPSQEPPRTAPVSSLMAMEGSAQELSSRAGKLLQSYYREGYVDRAVEQLQSALQQKADYPLAEARLSLAYGRKNSANPDLHWQQQALAHAELAVRGDSQLALAHIAHGASLVLASRPDDADAAYRKALTLDPGSPELLWRMGDLAVRKDSKAAEQHYLRAVAAGPKDWEAHSKLGGFYYRQSRYSEAVKEYEAMRDLAQDHPRAHSSLGAVYHHLDRTDEAAAAFQRSLEFAPNAITYSNLGTLLYFQGKFEEAARAFEEAVKRGSNTYANWGNLADAVRWNPGGKERARESYTRAIQLAREHLVTLPNDREVQSSMAVYLARSGQREPALAEVNRMLAQKDLTAAVLVKLSIVAEIAGQRAQAFDLLRRGLSAGYKLREIRQEPDLVQLRSDPEYHKIAVSFEK